jgi:enoyl-CoA hydratase/carnithine racemase
MLRRLNPPETLLAEGARTLETGSPEVLCRIAQRVGVVTLNRPDAKNALSMDMKRALHRVIPELGASADVGCLLLTGAGGAFCAGGDTKRMASEGRPPSPEDRKRQLRWEHEIPRALHRLEKPTVAALPGPAAGAGFALALACDLRLMAESAFATTAYARLGLSGDYGASWFLTRLLGPARARELMFLGERLSAADCERLGLANRVLPDAGFADTAFEYARRLAAGPPIALRYMKDNLNRAITDSLESVLDAESERMVQGAGTEDYEEAVKAFAEKRAPEFKGR